MKIKNKSFIKILPITAAIAISALLSLIGWEYLNYQKKLESANPEFLYEITLADPLFYSPKLDTKKLEMSVEGLKSQEKLLRNQLPEKYPKTFLYPLEFFKLLPIVTKDTKTLLEKKDFKSGVKLLNDYDKTVHAYKKAASEQKKFVETLASNPAFAKRHYIELSSATNLNVLLNDFTLIEENGLALQNEVEKRKQCFYKGICPAIISRETAPKAETPKKSATVKTVQVIPEELLTINDSRFQKLGPYFVKTACFGNTKENPKPEQLMYILLETLSKPDLIMPIFNPKLVGENYYYDLTFNRTIVGETLIGRNVKFYFQPEGANYLCADLEYWSDLSLAATGDKLVYFPEMINALANNLATYRKALPLNPLPSPDILMAIFSNYSLGYMPFHESVWRISERPRYMEKEALRPIAYKTYTELKKIYSIKIFKTFHFRLSDIRERLIAEKESKLKFFEWLYSNIVYDLPLKVINILPVEFLPRSVIK